VFLVSYGTLLTDMTLYQFANMVKGFAIAVGVAAAIVMAAKWWQRSQRAARVTREAHAKRVYATYLLQAMQHPELARPSGEEAAKSRARTQYQWFLGFLLTTAEEILLVDPSDTWRETIARQLAAHREFLASAAFREGPYRGLSSELKGLVDDAIVHGGEGPTKSSNVRPLHANR